MASTGGRERRRRPRVAVTGDVLGRIHSVSSAPVLDISESGALLEVSTVLRPGALYMLRLGMDDVRSVSVKSRVVRTYVHSFQGKAGGDATVTYRAALEFVDLTDAQRAVLRDHLGELRGSLDLELE